MNADNNGPAFPVVELNRETGNVCDQHFGVSVRDYFAAKAMQGELAAMCASPDDGTEGIAGLSLEIPDHSLSRLATHWYRIADAMLKARTAATAAPTTAQQGSQP